MKAEKEEITKKALLKELEFERKYPVLQQTIDNLNAAVSSHRNIDSEYENEV